jgi:hypothetical protein
MSETPTQFAYNEDLDKLQLEIESLKKENQLLRNALTELEAEKITLSQSYLTTALSIKKLLQSPNANPT